MWTLRRTVNPTQLMWTEIWHQMWDDAITSWENTKTSLKSWSQIRKKNLSNCSVSGRQEVITANGNDITFWGNHVGLFYVQTPSVTEGVLEIYKREAKTSGPPSGAWLQNCCKALFLIGLLIGQHVQWQDGGTSADILASVLYSVEICVGMSWLWRKHF